MRELKRADFLVPGPLLGSGGHRTIYRNAKALHESGCRVTMHVDCDRKRGARAIRKIGKWYDTEGLTMSPVWPDAVGTDLLLATTWQSAWHASRVQTDGSKAHFVQDYESWFYPRGDQQIGAAGAHDLGLETVVIGNWLSEFLKRNHGLSSTTIPFTADLDRYGSAGGAGRSIPGSPQAVAIFQPEKPRRCPDLMEAALSRLIDTVADVKVVTVGSRFSPKLSERHEHLGVVSPEQLSRLYRSSSVGLSLSTSNPSRIPFEMMAAGLPVVELGAENNIYDLPEDGCLLAHPDPASLAQAMAQVIAEPELATSLSKRGTTFMSNRYEARENEAFVDALRSIAGRNRSISKTLAPLYGREFVRADERTSWYPRNHSGVLDRIRRKAIQFFG